MCTAKEEPEFYSELPKTKHFAQINSEIATGARIFPTWNYSEISRAKQLNKAWKKLVHMLPQNQVDNLQILWKESSSRNHISKSRSGIGGSYDLT